VVRFETEYLNKSIGR